MASLKGLTNLHSLDLSHTNVTDAGLEQLFGIDLYYLNLEGTEVTAEGVAKLRRALRGKMIEP